MKPIILIINDLDFGGGQKTVVAEANELHRRQIPVYVVTTLAGARLPLQKMLTIGATAVIHVPFRSLFDVHAYRALYDIFRRIQPSVVLSHLFFTNTITRILLLFFPSIRVVVREGNVPVEKSFFAICIDALLSLRTYAIIGNSTRVLEDMPPVFTKKILLYNGIDDVFFNSTADRATVREALGLAHDETAVLCVGSLTEKKGQHNVIAALKALGERGKTTRLFFAGDGPLQNVLQKKAQELTPNQISFLGARADIPELLKGTDVFVLPSLWEGMPNAMLEAMATGVPVIASDVGGVSEILHDGENGFLVTTADVSALAEKLDILCHDEALRKRLGEAGRAAVSHLTWQKHTDTLLGSIGT